MLGSLDVHATGLPLLDAQADFRRARRAHAVARISGRLRPRGRAGCPRSVQNPATLVGGFQRLKVIRLDSIVGTVEPTSEFDDRFRPASERVRWRWERIALAHRQGDALPPIVVREQPEGYYILDGRHRVSVALALGHKDIDAWVTGPAWHR